MSSTTKIVVTVAALAAVGGAIYFATRPAEPAKGAPAPSSSPWWSQLIRGTVDVGVSLYHDLTAKKAGGDYDVVPKAGAGYTGSGAGSGSTNTVLA